MMERHTNSPAAIAVQQSSRVLENEYVGVSKMIHKCSGKVAQKKRGGRVFVCAVGRSNVRTVIFNVSTCLWNATKSRVQLWPAIPQKKYIPAMKLGVVTRMPRQKFGDL